MDGEARPHDPERLPPRDDYGADWVYVEAPDAAAALAAALAWDEDRHPALAEMELFRAAYRAGAVLLPGDAWCSLDEAARRAGVSPATVRSWTRRHPGFPADLSGRGRAWSDVAAWLRDTGRRPLSQGR